MIYFLEEEGLKVKKSFLINKVNQADILDDIHSRPILLVNVSNLSN